MVGRKKHCKEDADTSLLIHCLHVIEALLECKIYVTHVKRCSTKMADLPDKMSRRATSWEKEKQAILGKEWAVESPALEAWLRWLALNWELPKLLCNDVKKLLK